MGMGEKKARARAYKQQTEQALTTEVLEVGLFSAKAVETDYAIECIREPWDAAVATGNKVRLVDMRDRIVVFIGVQDVGFVAPELAQNLRDQFGLQQRRGRAIFGEVIDVSEFSPTFIVTIRP